VNRERNATVIMVTHSSDLALRAGTRLRMKHGVVERLS
jgi:ABC-type lipoprotein export system ATPase subunit